MRRADLAGGGCWLAVISARRPWSVARMTAKAGAATWYVGHGEAREYKVAGAGRVVEAGGLVEARNAALDDAGRAGLICVQVSDDLGGVGEALPGSPARTVRRSFGWAIQRILSQDGAARLMGVAPAANPQNFRADKPVRKMAFIVGDLCAVRPTDLRFSPEFRLKEDYDYTLQHIARYGEVARHDAVLARFVHRMNAGGVVTYRTWALEREMIGLLRAKWGKAIRRNGRGDGEIALAPEAELRALLGR